MSQTNKTTDYYLTGLRNQHAVEGQAAETIQGQIGRMADYPELHARMQMELEQTRGQAQRLETLLKQHGTDTSTTKEAVTSVIGKVSGLVHMTATDEVLKNVLAAIGFKAYEIASYKVLLTLADAAGASDDKAVLEQSMKEEQEMGDWLGSHLPELVHAYVGQQQAA